MDKEKEIHKQRKSYYQKNKEKMNLIARERYHSKKDDPAFYKNMLEKNQQAYYKKKGYVEKTPEEEEAYFRDIQKYIASVRDKVKETFTKLTSMKKFINCFFKVKQF
jgi:nitrous oxide reductase